MLFSFDTYELQAVTWGSQNHCSGIVRLTGHWHQYDGIKFMNGDVYGFSNIGDLPLTPVNNTLNHALYCRRAL